MCNDPKSSAHDTSSLLTWIGEIIHLESTVPRKFVREYAFLNKIFRRMLYMQGITW